MSAVRRSRDSDRDWVVAAMAAAFAADPAIRWFLPDDAGYPHKGRAIFGYVFDVRHIGGEVWVNERHAAAAWTPPGGLAPMIPAVADRWQALGEALAPDELERMEEYGGLLESLLPDTPHWYLGVLATEPSFQGMGYGRSVIAPIAARADESGIAQTLETCVPANRKLYERLGYQVTGEFRPPGGPLVWVMVRQPPI